MNQSREAAHPNVIIHVDIDYFYAQVEEVLNPELKDKPFGIQQGMNLVTCNYIARSFGIKKWRPLKECLEKCPELVLVNGEDLSNYKIYSKKISELLHTLIGPSERMGLDEHYLNITKQVEEELEKMGEDELKNLHMTGPFYPSEEAFIECDCGCENRLIIGSQIAKKIRDKMLEDLKLTCSVGIAHNKLLAKLVGQLNKPNNQTTLAPTAAAIFMADLKDLRSIMGIGGKTASRLEELGLQSIAELQNCETKKLIKSFCQETATRLKELSMGIDTSEVKPSEKPKTVGLEDSFKPISTRTEAEENLRDLLPQLVRQIQDDGRIPLSIRLTVRKYDVKKKISSRETRQCALLPSHFKWIEERIQLADGSEDKIMKNVMNLFDQIVDAKQKFFINLVGLCFCKFQEQKKGAGAITSFLRKMPDASVVEMEPNESDIKDETVEPSAKRQKIDEIRAETTTKLPTNIDPSVWNELPLELQRELMASWRPSTSVQELPQTSKNKSNTLQNHLMRK